MSSAPAALRRTPLFERHQAAGAKLVDFAGWEMPVQYKGVRQEHIAVRQGCGIFDVSHMGEIETSGPQALELLQLLLSNDASAMTITGGAGGARYRGLPPPDRGGADGPVTHRPHVAPHPPNTHPPHHHRRP